MPETQAGTQGAPGQTRPTRGPWGEDRVDPEEPMGSETGGLSALCPEGGMPRRQGAGRISDGVLAGACPPAPQAPWQRPPFLRSRPPSSGGTPTQSQPQRAKTHQPHSSDGPVTGESWSRQIHQIRQGWQTFIHRGPDIPRTTPKSQ